MVFHPEKNIPPSSSSSSFHFGFSYYCFAVNFHRFIVTKEGEAER